MRSKAYQMPKHCKIQIFYVLSQRSRLNRRKTAFTSQSTLGTRAYMYLVGEDSALLEVVPRCCRKSKKFSQVKFFCRPTRRSFDGAHCIGANGLAPFKWIRGLRVFSCRATVSLNAIMFVLLANVNCQCFFQLLSSNEIVPVKTVHRSVKLLLFCCCFPFFF